MRDELLVPLDELDDEREYPLEVEPLEVDEEIDVLFFAAESVSASYTRRVDCDEATLDDEVLPARKDAIDFAAELVVALDEEVVPLEVREYVLREGFE